MSKPAPHALSLRVQRWRLLPGHKLPRGSAPLGVSLSAPVDVAQGRHLDAELLDGDAVWFQPNGIDPEAPAALAAVLPAPSEARLIVVSPLAAEASFFARVLGREIRLPRAVRGSALLLRGYRSIEGGLDPASGLDLCWACA